MPQAYGLALVKMDVHVYSYRQLRLNFGFHEDMLVLEISGADLRDDVHTDDKNNFETEAKEGNEEADANIGLESVKESIAMGMSVTVVVRLNVVLNWIHVGSCWLLEPKLKDVSVM